MKVPTYTAQVQRTTEVGGQRMSVQASPQQFARGAEAAKAFYAQAEDAAFQYGKAELQQRNETERLKAINESNRMLSESAAAAEQIAINDPDAADQYFQDSVEFHRKKQSELIQNDATRQQFLLQYDATSQRSTAQVTSYTRAVRARQGTAVWIGRESDLINRASNGDTAAMLELYGDPDQGIKGHYDLGVENGFIAVDKAAGRSNTSRTLVAKNRLINHVDGLDTIDKLTEFTTALEAGELPPEISNELSLLLPSEIKQLKKAVQSEIKTEQALKDAADALLSDEQRLMFEQTMDDPTVDLEMKKGILLNLSLGTPEQFGMTSSDFRAAKAYSRARLSNTQATVNAAARSIAKSQKELMSILTDGFDPGLDAILNVDREIAAMGESAPDSLVQDQLAMQRAYSTINAMRGMGPVELDQYVAGIEQEFEGKMTTEAATIIKNGRTMQSKLVSRISGGDAMGAAQDRGIVSMPTLIPDMYMPSGDGQDVVRDESGTPVINPEFRDAIAQRKRAAEKVSDTFKLTKPQFLTKAERNTYKERLKFGDSGTRMAILQSLVTGFGSDAPTVLAEISDEKHVGVYGHIGGLIADGRNEAAEDILRGKSILDDGVAIVGFDKAINDIHFRNEVGTAFYGLDAEGALREAADAIYAARYGRSPEGYRPTNYQNAIQAAAGRTPDGKGGIDPVNGAPTIIPQNMSAADLTDLLATLREEELINPQISGQNVSKKIAADIRNKTGNYKIHPAPGTGKYFVYRGEIGIDDYKHIKDTNGDPLLIDFAALYELRGR
jgi:hypothetical protein